MSDATELHHAARGLDARTEAFLEVANFIVDEASKSPTIDADALLHSLVAWLHLQGNLCRDDLGGMWLEHRTATDSAIN